MLAKFWCVTTLKVLNQAEKLRRMGSCVRKNCVRRCNQLHSDDEYAFDCSEQLAVSTCANSADLRTALLQWCSSRNFRAKLGMEQVRMMTARCKSTLSRKARGWTKADTKTRKEIARATRAIRTSTRARTVPELDIGRTTAGVQVEEPATIPPVKQQLHTDRQEPRRAKTKANKWTVGTNQWSESASTVSYPSQTPSTIGALSWIMGLKVNSVSSTR